MNIETKLNMYFTLMNDRPDLFENVGLLDVITDRKIIEQYVCDTGDDIGVEYASEYHLLVVDLVIDENNNYFRYERLIPTKVSRGVVCVPIYKEKFILLNQFRHATRKYQLSFPRGFGEKNLNSCDNAEKELLEEIGATVKSTKIIGTITPNSGILSDSVDIVFCEVEDYNFTIKNEGICNIVEITLDELKEKISSGKVDDSFTLSAMQLLGCIK